MLRVDLLDKFIAFILRIVQILFGWLADSSLRRENSALRGQVAELKDVGADR